MHSKDGHIDLWNRKTRCVALPLKDKGNEEGHLAEEEEEEASQQIIIFLDNDTNY